MVTCMRTNYINLLHVLFIFLKLLIFRQTEVYLILTGLNKKKTVFFLKVFYFSYFFK
ncbi:hypothetical protein CPARA_2gp189 (nucleomorph) [Cryptomonas paramecium]|uniref:Uncharacterized protein n=1 Tax=Cryptomonas paramaecium TaxID=2898 RepID=F2HHQ1_9CRYP|nr:hypothetical protein CPARA_2gp189 [Cryptomonas paramecium]AEA38847.1 hypothetical protein CPARA_2gp189 [Cryptomonas paramecium]